jgi:hypothetical protein
MSDFDEIQRIIRLKRFEQPGPNYVEETLQRFHRRQSAELIHRPLWRLALDRMSVHMGSALAGPQLAYATALIAVAITAVTVFGPRLREMGAVASNNADSNQNRIRLETGVPVSYVQGHPQPTGNTDLDLLQLLSNRQPTTSSPSPTPALVVRRADSPRYVIDTRPVSYDASLSF